MVGIWYYSILALINKKERFWIGEWVLIPASDWSTYNATKTGKESIINQTLI